jgi:hypothetical protein
MVVVKGNAKLKAAGSVRKQPTLGPGLADAPSHDAAAWLSRGKRPGALMGEKPDPVGSSDELSLVLIDINSSSPIERWLVGPALSCSSPPPSTRTRTRSRTLGDTAPSSDCIAYWIGRLDA